MSSIRHPLPSPLRASQRHRFAVALFAVALGCSATPAASPDAAAPPADVSAVADDAATDVPVVDIAPLDVSPADVPADRPSCAPADAAASEPFTALYDRIIRPRGCATSGCHEGGDPGSGAAFRGGFDMTSAAAAYASLVGVRGCRTTRVVPCRPEESYFLDVVRVSDGVCAGRRHAPGMLPPDEVAMLESWIRAGAR
ncbi:MAG: hypothetical protein JWM10_1956 [Myxococcaceae bacterium]|nr:hypothetical protein [Myxococcaceae bacterium]